MPDNSKWLSQVMWDNRVTMHRARPFDNSEVRDMHRTTVACEQSTMEQAA